MAVKIGLVWAALSVAGMVIAASGQPKCATKCCQTLNSHGVKYVCYEQTKWGHQCGEYDAGGPPAEVMFSGNSTSTCPASISVSTDYIPDGVCDR